MRALILLSLIIVAGCQSMPSRLWASSVSKDEFTDEVTKMVTVGSVGSNGYFYTEAGKFYPFVGTSGGELYVGLRSGGTYRIPTGTVQLRVDDNEAWTITPDETPANLVPAVPAVAGANPNLTADMMANMTKMLSPYTAATGEKAQQILKQMIQGKALRYRTIGLNQASSVGETRIDESFIEAIRTIGIDPNSF